MSSTSTYSKNNFNLFTKPYELSLFVLIRDEKEVPPNIINIHTLISTEDQSASMNEELYNINPGNYLYVYAMQNIAIRHATFIFFAYPPSAQF